MFAQITGVEFEYHIYQAILGLHGCKSPSHGSTKFEPKGVFFGTTCFTKQASTLEPPTYPAIKRPACHMPVTTPVSGPSVAAKMGAARLKG